MKKEAERVPEAEKFRVKIRRPPPLTDKSERLAKNPVTTTHATTRSLVK